MMMKLKLIKWLLSVVIIGMVSCGGGGNGSGTSVDSDNDGNVSYTLNSMDLSTYMENSKRPDDYTPFNFSYTADQNPEQTSRILEHSNQLVLQPANWSITIQSNDVDLSLAAQNIRERTAEIIIDFGDNQAIKTERYRVVIDTSVSDTLSFDDMMSQRLNFEYQFSAESFPGVNDSHTGLLSVGSLAINVNTNRYWLVAHTFTPASSPAGTKETTLYNILKNDYSANDINLRKGDVLYLAYITDSDLDGLSDRLEILNGTDRTLADSDSDGLDDAQEVYGWYTNLTGVPCEIGDDLVLVFGNPLLSDTDDDGIDDSAEFDACTDPQGELEVNAGIDKVASLSENVTLTAEPANYLTKATLSYQWVQTKGISVGALSNAASITFSTPDQVTSLQFQVTVTDTAQVNSNSSDDILVLIAKNKEKAVFVETDIGHGLNNDGLTPGTPIKAR